MRTRVLVCGTNYGRRYLEAIAAAPRRYELAGILARGSTRSALTAAAYGVPLFTSVDKVPRVDAAFAAMGPEGNPAVLELLRRGIGVLCEHPLKPAFLRKALATAAVSGARFQVNTHFSSLPAPRAFIRRCAAMFRKERPLFIDGALTPRLSFAFFDIVRRGLGAIGRIETNLRLEPRRPEGSVANLVDCRIAIGFPSGILTLLSLAGPVILNATPHARGGPLAEIVFAQDEVTRVEFAAQRHDALKRSMAAFVRGTPQDVEHLLDVSRAAGALSAS